MGDKQRQEQELAQDRLTWVMVGFGLTFYAALGTVLVVFAVAY